MSILIKGMEMPKTGEYRCVIRKWQQGGPITIDLYGEEELCGTIVPVPPHGRLIDADALITRYEKQRAEDREILCDERAFPSDYERAQYRYSRNSDFISALKSQAAIIPAEPAEEGE